MLVGLIGAGAYGLVRYHFARTTDLALQHTMVYQLRLLGATPSRELEAADREWYATRGTLPTALPVVARSSGESEEEGEGGGVRLGLSGVSEEAFDSELAAIFVLPLDSQGGLLSSTPSTGFPIAPVGEAVAAALAHGSDWRTMRLTDGSRVRLLTYGVAADDRPAALQVGRSLADQDRILRQLLVGLLLLGVPSLAALGAASWWLAGRSLLPAQQAWDRQQAFVANASHELRTPLTLMRASAEVALRGLRAGDRRRELLQDILAETDHMNRLVEDQLLLARLDAGEVALSLGPVPLDELMAEVHRQFVRIAEERGVRLLLGSAAGEAIGDLTRLRQLLLILLDNALAHTPHGGSITMGAAVSMDAVAIVVSDTGRGIPAEHLPRVFDRFYRADEGSLQGPGGSGLGLAIAKALVEAQGGQIRLESRLGRGTRVTLTLPRA